MKAIIILPMSNSAHRPPCGKFRHSPEHNAHIFEGRELDMDEFNANFEKARAPHDGHFPPVTVRMVEVKSTISGAPKDVEVPSSEDPALAALRESAAASGYEAHDPPPAPDYTPAPRKRRARLKPGVTAALTT